MMVVGYARSFLRQIIMPAVVFAGMLLVVKPASAQTDQTDLDQPAILVKAPGNIFFTAIAEAGTRLVAVGEHGVISYSNDLGESWHQAAVPTDVLLTAVAFANAQDGWAVGHFGVILNTNDGGLTWHKQLDGNQVNEMALQAAQALPANSPLITAKYGIVRAKRFIANGPDLPFLTVDALSSKDVVALGAYRLADITHDGGKTWQDLTLNIADNLSHNLYGVGNIGPDIYIAAETGLVFRSTDQGASFAPVTQPSTTTLFGVLGTKDGAALVYGVAGTVFLSHDHGTTWQPISIGTSSNITAGLALSSGAVLLASEDGTLYISYSNGQSFTRLPQIVPMLLTGLVETPGGGVAVSGSSGVVVLPAAVFLQAK